MEELYEILGATGFPVAYHHFDKEVKPSYIVYYESSQDYVRADGTNYYTTMDITIELYTCKKDVLAEDKLTGLLANHEIEYTKIAETYIDQEKLYQHTYEITIGKK